MATELAKAYVQIIPSAKGIKGSITNVISGEANSAGKSAGTSIASKIKSAIVASGIGKTIGEALAEGAELQQSLGGVETLFKDSANKVIKNAEIAYRTAGLSANEYMESVTSFSASLLQSLANDTNKAADVADMALTDMSDNANKMGTAMESIQNAYQGFAKQNYTMLDNLKLGYGGTKAEMQRLLEDAEKLSGIKYDISNLSDIYNAIHVIQEELGIAGTTAKEASETYSGSLAAMVAAGKNVLANLTLGEDIVPSLKALKETTWTFVKGNLLPMAGNIAKGIVSLIAESGSEMITNGANMLVSFIEGISQKIPELAPKGLEMIVTMCDTIIENLPAIGKAGIELIASLVKGIIEGLPTLIVEAPRIINDFAETIYSLLGELILTGIEMIVSLVKGIWGNRGLLLENAGEIFMAFINVFSLSNIFNLGKNLIQNMINGIKNLGPNVIKTGGNIVEFFVSGIKNLATQPVTTLKNIASNAIKTMKNLDWKSIGSNIISGIVNGLKNGINTIINTAKSVAGAALSAAKKALGIKSPSRIFENEVGKMIDMGLAAGIEKNISAVSDSMKELSMATVGMIDTDSLSIARPNVDPNSNLIQDNILDSIQVIVENHVSVDGTPLKEKCSNYTIRKINYGQRDLLKAKGGYSYA